MSTNRIVRVILTVSLLCGFIVMASCGWDDSAQVWTDQAGNPITTDQVGGAASTAAGIAGAFVPGVSALAPMIGAAASGLYGIAATVYGAIQRSKKKKAEGWVGRLAPFAEAGEDIIRAVGEFRRNYPDAWPQLKAVIEANGGDKHKEAVKAVKGSGVSS